jgi:hypothetical protein
MQRVNVFQFYTLGHSVRELIEVSDGVTLPELITRLATANIELWRFLITQGIPSLPTVHSEIARVTKAIQDIWSPGPDTKGIALLGAIPPTKVSALKEATHRFETILSAELARADIYSVSKKGIYDTSELIEHADKVLPEGLRARLSHQARYVDAHQNP